MELLHVDQVVREPGERVFRHGFLGSLVMWASFLSPLALALVKREELATWIAMAAWLEWLLLSPFVLLGGLVWLLCLWACGLSLHRALGPSNWLVRMSPAGLVVNLRSFHNAHFPHDSPTVARLAWSEIARVREVRDVSASDSNSAAPRRWLQLELVGVDTAELAALVARERSRPGPERSFLGVRSAGRFQHVPAFVPEPGVMRIDWLGQAMLRALGARVSVAETLALGSGAGTPAEDVETRMRELALRGDRMAAIRVAREELGLPLRQARARIDELALAAR